MEIQVVLDWKVLEILNRPRSPKAQRILENQTMSKQSDVKFWSPNTAIINSNVEGLMGAKITVIDRDGDTRQGIIAGVDPYIGISVVKESDHTEILYCLHGPFDPSFREHYLTNRGDVRGQFNKRWPITLSYVRTAVETGSLNLADLFAEYGTTGFSVGASCPFSA